MKELDKPSTKVDSTSTGFYNPAAESFTEMRTPSASDLNSGKVGALNIAQRTLDRQFGEAPTLTDTPSSETFEKLSFSRTQQIQLKDGETSETLHERLRPIAVAGFQSVRNSTQIDTPSWYTFDASKTLGIENAVAIITSTCKHELPYKVFVGIRGADWDTSGRLPSGEQGHRYKLRDLGRELTEQEKNAIYDKM